MMLVSNDSASPTWMSSYENPVLTDKDDKQVVQVIRVC